MRRAELGLLVNNETLLWRPVLDAALRLAQRYTVKQATPSYDVEDVMAIGGKTALIISTDGKLNQASRIAMESMSGQQQHDVGFKIPALPAQLEGIRHNVACGLQAAGQQLTRAAHGIRPKQLRWPQGSEAQVRAPCRRRRLLLPNGKFAAIIPGDTIAEQVITTGVSQFLSLYNTAIIARLVLTWFPNPPQAIAGPLSTLCDPYLNLFRGIIPPLGGTIDLSPILAFIALDLFSNTAAALPCELNEDGTVRQPKKTGLQLTPSQFLGQWQRRQQAKRRETNKGQSGSAQA